MKVPAVAAPLDLPEQQLPPPASSPPLQELAGEIPVAELASVGLPAPAKQREDEIWLASLAAEIATELAEPAGPLEASPLLPAA